MPFLCVGGGLPEPGGTNSVGTRVLFLVDRSRTLPPNTDEDAGEGRPVTVQLWYPSDGSSGKGPAPYLTDPSLVELMIDQGYFGQKEEVLRGWCALDTHARLDPGFADGGPWPVLLLSHGMGVARASYTALAVELASRGYVVAALDHPCGGVTVLEDGDVLSTEDDPELEARWQERVLEWVNDFRFVLDELDRSTMRAQLRLERVGVLGHSMGGAAALAAAGRDERIATCVDLDGTPAAFAEREGLRRPSLFVKSQPIRGDEPLVASGLPSGNDSGPVSWDAIAAHVSAPSLYVGFAGTGHMTFSDAPFVMPDTITRFGGKLVPCDRAWHLFVALVSAFLDVQLRGGSERELMALDEEPELALVSLPASH